MMAYLILIFFSLCSAVNTSAGVVRLKSIAHLSGLQENPITGYGLVIGLAGSGDSHRNHETTQAIANLLQAFGVNMHPADINSRNTATVVVTANLPTHAHQGDKLDINVASLGDAKSLLGGTLLVTPLKGPDNQTYALAQGALSLGGYKYDLFGNVIQKNHPTTGVISGGAIVERNLNNTIGDQPGGIHLILNRADFTTADLVETAINQKFGNNTAKAKSAQDIEIHPPAGTKHHFIRFISTIENLKIIPDQLPTVVVNERTGVVVAGGDVRLDAVSIAHGNLQITIASSFAPSTALTGFSNTALELANTLTVKEKNLHVIRLTRESNIADLISALNNVHTATRDIIAILESLKRAGALHAELIVE